MRDNVFAFAMLAFLVGIFLLIMRTEKRSPRKPGTRRKAKPITGGINPRKWDFNTVDVVLHPMHWDVGIALENGCITLGNPASPKKIPVDMQKQGRIRSANFVIDENGIRLNGETQANGIIARIKTPTPQIYFVPTEDCRVLADEKHGLTTEWLLFISVKRQPVIIEIRLLSAPDKYVSCGQISIENNGFYVESKMQAQRRIACENWMIEGMGF